MSVREGLTRRLPRVRLAVLPTPYEEAPRLASALGGARVFVKREDLSGLALGGNKPRQLEYLMAAALAEGAGAVVTTAGLQSNFCRAAAAACARLGLKIGLLLRGKEGAPLQGNYLLDRVLGAEVRVIPTDDPYDPRVDGWLDEFVQDFARRGLKAYVIHLPGRTGALGAAAMVSAAEEMTAQFAQAGVTPGAVYLAAGSGLTVAGLTLGFKHLRAPTRVVGVSVQRRADFMAPLIARRANEAAELLGLDSRVDPGDFDFDDRNIGPGYGMPTREGVEALALVGRTEGLVLDPVYTGKAMAGMVSDLRAGRFSRGAAVAFFHSGGAPGLFAHAEAVAAMIPA